MPDFRFGGAYPDSPKHAPLNVRRSEKEFRPSRTRVRNVMLLHVEDGSIFEAGRPWSGGTTGDHLADAGTVPSDWVGRKSPRSASFTLAGC